MVTQTIKTALGARTSLSASSALNSLTSSCFAVIGTLTFSTGGLAPLTNKLEIFIAPGTVAGNKQAVVYAQQSLDGTNFETGPTSGSATTDAPNLTFIGPVPCNTAGGNQRRIFDLGAAFGGALPFAAKIIIYNDTGVALSASGHEAWYIEITGNSA